MLKPLLLPSKKQKEGADAVDPKAMTANTVVRTKNKRRNIKAEEAEGPEADPVAGPAADLVVRETAYWKEDKIHL